MTKKWNDPEAIIEAQRYDNPIPSRTALLAKIEASEQGFTYDEIAYAFDLDQVDNLEALRRRLNAMLRDGQLIRVGQYYQRCEDHQEFDATVQINSKGQGFAVIAERDDLLLSERELRLVFDGDRIRVRPTTVDRRGRVQGFITEIIKHQVQQLIGELSEHEGEFFVLLAAPNAHQPIALERELVDHAGAQVGDFIRVAIDRYPTRNEFAAAHIVQSMAGLADTEIIIPATILEYGLPYEFPKEVVAEAEAFKAPTAKDFKNRTDLRDLPLVTIDGEDARDFDDAVFAEKRPGGGYRVVVAIADVSHYVKVDRPLDDEAQLRGTSVYFPHYVLPMLPEALSNGLCSLNPHVDRLCMVCELILTRTGKVSSYQFYPAVMHSKARLTYTQVGEFLHGNQAAVDDDAAIRKSLNTLYQLYQTLLTLRQKRHAMEFETVETYMTFDDKGAIDQILPRTRNDAHRLIEECMLLANVAAADFAMKQDIPVLYRVHEAPEASRIQKVRDYVKVLGLTFPERPTQADYQYVIEATRDRVDATSIHAVLLRSMMQAYYTPHNAGHYGLAYEAYTHFTSPIRRYPDLLLHRAIKAKLAGKSYALEGAALNAAGEHFSQTERRADEASRSVTSWLKCHYMQQHIGEQFQGIISAVTDFGLFVTLTTLFVDGMIHISQLGDDYFVYDSALQRLVGQHHGQTFALGDLVLIKVVAVNLDERKIDFGLVRQLNSAGRPVRSKAPRVAKSSDVASSAPNQSDKRLKTTSSHAKSDSDRGDTQQKAIKSSRDRRSAVGNSSKQAKTIESTVAASDFNIDQSISRVSRKSHRTAPLDAANAIPDLIQNEAHNVPSERLNFGDNPSLDNEETKPIVKAKKPKQKEKAKTKKNAKSVASDQSTQAQPDKPAKKTKQKAEKSKKAKKNKKSNAKTRDDPITD